MLGLRCKPCAPAPCRQIDPEICEPPPTTDSPMQVVVIDNNGCYRLLANNSDQAPFLIRDAATGKLKWVNGDETGGKALYFGDVTKINSGVSHIIGLNPTTGNANATRPANAGQFPSIPYVNTSGGNILWEGLKNLILQIWNVAGSAYGVFTRNSSGNLVVVDGNDGDVIQRVSGEWVANPLAAPEQAFYQLDNLRIQTAAYISGSAGTTVTATADRVGVSDGTNTLLLSAFNQSLDMAQSGIGGLDTGVLAGNTFYYVYAVAQSDGTPGLIASLSSVSPTMPVGWTYYRRLGAIRSIQTGPSTYAVSPQLQMGNRAMYRDGGAGTGSFRDYTDDGNILPMTLTLIPPIAKTWTGQLIYGPTSYVQDLFVEIYPSQAAPGAYKLDVYMFYGANTDGDRRYVNDVPILPAVTPGWMARAPNSLGAGHYDVQITPSGYTI